MMLDLGQFSDPNFDPRKVVNSACQTRHTQDSVDKHMVDLEMKLQMVSEEIAASLEEQSASALLRVPRATRDVVRLRDDAVSSILDKLKKAEGSSAESIAISTRPTTLSLSSFVSNSCSQIIIVLFLPNFGRFLCVVLDNEGNI